VTDSIARRSAAERELACEGGPTRKLVHAGRGRACERRSGPRTRAHPGGRGRLIARRGAEVGTALWIAVSSRGGRGKARFFRRLRGSRGLFQACWTGTWRAPGRLPQRAPTPSWTTAHPVSELHAFVDALLDLHDNPPRDDCWRARGRAGRPLRAYSAMALHVRTSCADAPPLTKVRRRRAADQRAQPLRIRTAREVGW